MMITGSGRLVVDIRSRLDARLAVLRSRSLWARHVEMKELLEMGTSLGTFRLLSVDFRAARRQIEALTDVSPGARARAFAAYVGLFDFADEYGSVDVPSERIASTFEISRMSWLSYRSVLVEAGLLLIATQERGTRKALQLKMPSS